MYVSSKFFITFAVPSSLPNGIHRRPETKIFLSSCRINARILIFTGQQVYFDYQIFLYFDYKLEGTCLFSVSEQSKSGKERKFRRCVNNFFFLDHRNENCLLYFCIESTQRGTMRSVSTRQSVPEETLKRGLRIKLFLIDANISGVGIS